MTRTIQTQKYASEQINKTNQLQNEISVSTKWTTSTQCASPFIAVTET